MPRAHDATPRRSPSALIVTHYWHPHIGGVETVARRHADELARRGWEIRPHSTRLPRGAPADDGTDDLVVVRHPAANPFERSIAVPVPIPAPGFSHTLRLAAQHVDLVVAHGHVYPTSVGALRAARRASRPFVLVQHNPWVDYPTPLDLVEHAADRAIGSRVLQLAHTVVCVSRHTEDYVRSIAPTASTIVIPNGVDTTVFRPRDGCRAQRRFVCVRRLVPRTGVATLIDAWRRAALEGWELVIVGDGPERAALQRAASDLPGVRFHQELSTDELVGLLRSAWATVVPTTSGEGFGLVAAESQACGTPVIAARLGALVEVVTDDVDGVLVEPDSPQRLATTLRALAHDPVRRDRLADACRRRDWSWTDSGARLDRVLRGVVADAKVACA